VIAEFTIEGKPIPKARPRIANGRAYTPKRTSKYEKLVRARATAAVLWERDPRPAMRAGFRRREPAWPSALECQRFTKPPTKSCACDFCSGTFEVTLMMFMPDRRHRDIDNVTKSILDGCNGIVWRDDSQVSQVTATKLLDRDQPRVEVHVTSLGVPSVRSKAPQDSGRALGHPETETAQTGREGRQRCPSCGSVIRD
jgi:Holliday junction resolvase RusA-like endonuclease